MKRLQHDIKKSRGINSLQYKSIKIYNLDNKTQ